MYLGIEIGGTKLQLGLGAGDGVLKGLWRGAVDVAAGGDGIRRQILQAVPELLERAGVDRSAMRGVGVGFGGPVDDATRTVIRSHQIEGWDDFPLADWLGELLGLPVALGNDADVAGLAEALFGAGKGLSPIFYITIGSGIGGGLILDGEIYRGSGRGAAEIGHLQVVIEELGMSGTLESLASGWAIGQLPHHYYRDGLDGGEPPFWEPHQSEQRLEVAQVVNAALAGHLVASRVLAGAWQCLALGISQVIALLSPRRIVIGGGVSLIGEGRLFEPLRGLVAQRVYKPFAGSYDIVPAALGEEVVVHGALALARRRLA